MSVPELNNFAGLSVQTEEIGVAALVHLVTTQSTLSITYKFFRIKLACYEVDTPDFQ